MNFSLNKSIEMLERTPTVLSVLLENLSADWVLNNEGGETWAVFDVIGHLIHGEKTDWMVRTALILSTTADKNFTPFNRFAQAETNNEKTLQELLEELRQLRFANIKKLQALNISESDLQKTGIHPAFGLVTLSQLIATWVVHDLNHISQIARVMSKQYKEEVGPWIEFLKILKQ